jgi:hypothetical protein
MGRWTRAIIHGVSVSILMVAGIILVRGFLHSWEELAQPDFWIEKAVIFGIMAVLMTLFYWRVSRPQS